MRGRLLGLVTAEGSWASVLPATQASCPTGGGLPRGGEKVPTLPHAAFPRAPIGGGPESELKGAERCGVQRRVPACLHLPLPPLHSPHPPTHPRAPRERRGGPGV